MTSRRSVLGLLAAAPAALLLTRPAEARSARGISYGSGSLDIIAPRDATSAPVIVYVHGGGWRLGSRSEGTARAPFFNDLGYIVVTVSYALGSTPGKQAQQVGQAFNWVKANIAEYGGDPSRVALMGHSAGSHLASLAALSGAARGVKALIANDTAAYDVAYLAELNNGRLPVLYAGPFRDKSRWSDWSPISYAGGAGGMPVLVIWSGGENRDRVSKRFADALAARGHPVSRVDGSGYNHLTIRSAATKRGTAVGSAVAGFVQRHV